MNKKLLCLIFYFISITFCNLTYSQEQEVEKPLVQILQELEKKYDVIFSFETKTIEGISMRSLSHELSIKQALNQLHRITDLNFEMLSHRFIVITPKDTEELQSQTQHLEEVIIINYLTKGISKTNNGTIKANTKAFDILPGLIEPDVLQIVQNLPGIMSVDERISNINVRGGTNDQNLILYEGIRMYQSGHFFGLISAFNPYLSENITISKNGTSSKFGNAVSSTIAIKNADELDEKINVGIGGNMLSVDGFAKIPLSKKTELQLSARRSYTDILVSKTYDAYFDRIFNDSELNASTNMNTLLAQDERFLFYDFNAKFLYDINNTSKLRINVMNMSNNLNFNQVFTTIDNNFQETKSELNQTSYGASATYSKVINNGTNLSAQLYYSNYDLDAKNNNVTNNQLLTQENKVEDFGLRLDVSKTVSKDIKFNGGYQFNEVGVTNFEDVINPNYTSLVKEIIRTHALFGEVEWYSTSRDTYIRLGSRISYFGKLSEFLIEPRFTVNYKFLDYFRLEALGELKSQSITQIIDLQQDFFGIEKRRWQLANGNDVPLITSEQASIGLSYNQNNLLVSIEGYYKGVHNITARSQGFQNQFQFTNDIGHYTVKGIDFLINKRFSDFSTWLSYTYSKNDYNFNEINNSNSFSNTIDLRHVVNTSFTYNRANFKIAIGFNWHSGRPFTSPLDLQDNSNSTIEYNTPNSSRLGDYFRTDISAIYKFKPSKGINAEVGASVWNIFNQTNIINRYYTFNTDNAIVEINNKSLKFTPNLSFRVNF
ncbi:TonB-dependent receptor domain-containing protein [Winogradskyella thalassocola]|uniref:Outer membrane receptor for ferrienterochelin and colicins n=1 Tax=Winogradskyella thalassocola TaxID=262004 RepID=A0A1G8I9J8_9FLAO|nr:TonB-dependent receptor [Winogradskyella thalassocola]SDI15240.1 Outer membrane receptor for ferrienterochelin and colicins [Winogradskyella thalassocola]